MAGLTKKHFESIAKIINSIKKDIIIMDDDKEDVFNILVERLSAKCKHL